MPAMSAVLVAVYLDHSAAELVRTQLVKAGFPTDRVDLISGDELGQAKLVPRPTVDEKLTEYFRTIFQTDVTHDERSVQLLKRAVLEGRAAVIIQPRGEIETQSALRILGDAGPEDIRESDLQGQTLEHAATATETPVVTWVGKALAAAGAPDTTGTPRLP
jgi:hypothetical protein